MTVVVPTQRDEAWRYSDIDALAALAFACGGKHRCACWWQLYARDRARCRLQFTRSILNWQGCDRRDPYAEYRRQLWAGELNVTLHEGADFKLGAVQIGGGTQTLEIITTVTHAEPGRLIANCALSPRGPGNRHLSRQGRRGARWQQTDSEQSVKAMLLDRTATANAKPELEIYADE